MPNHLIVLGQSYPTPTGLVVTNHVEDHEVAFKRHPFPKRVTNIVIHESVCATKHVTVQALDGQGYGVHLIVSPDGAISQHGDLRLDLLWHAEQLNGCSIGIEIVNPYCPGNNPRTSPFKNAIPARWWTWVPSHGSAEYVLPTPAQIAALRLLVPYLCTVLPHCPLAFPTRDMTTGKMKHPGPGIVAHGDYGTHADGRYPLEQLFDLGDK